MWSIALRTLLADRGKLLTALVGVVFATVLVNVQGGLFLGLIRKAALLVDQSEADIWVGHRQMHNVDLAQEIPRRWIHRVRSVEGVARAEPYVVGLSEMALPSGGYEGVVIVGVERESLLGGAWNLTGGRPDSIQQTDGIIVDESDIRKLEYPAIGDVREVGGRRARIVDFSRGITGFLFAPYVFTTLDRAAVYLHQSPGQCSYFLVQVEPGADTQEVCAAIRARVPQLDVMTSDQYGYTSIDFWMTRTGLGISFGAATLLGLMVGMAIVAQTLYAMALDRLGEFATLKALGATQHQIYGMLFTQAWLMAAVGSAVGLVVVSVVQYVYHTPRAPIVIPWWLSLGSCLLMVLICLTAALLPYLRIRKLDPLMVLQS